MIGTRWKPVVPIRKPDSIIASTKFQNVKPFMPSYEEEKNYHFTNSKKFLEQQECHMAYLLSWEYGRKWFAERTTWTVLQYPPRSQLQEICYRQQVIRNMKRPTPKDVPDIKLKRFLNIPAKTDHKNTTMKKRNG